MSISSCHISASGRRPTACTCASSSPSCTHRRARERRDASCVKNGSEKPRYFGRADDVSSDDVVVEINNDDDEDDDWQDDDEGDDGDDGVKEDEAWRGSHVIGVKAAAQRTCVGATPPPRSTASRRM